MSVQSTALLLYADGVARLAETSKTDDGWLRGLAFGLRDTARYITELEAERDRLASQVETMRAALTEISCQHTSWEREDTEEEGADIDGAYDTAIKVARAALSSGGEAETSNKETNS